MSELKRLIAVWNKKLRKSGFVDIEAKGQLKKFHSKAFREFLPEELEERRRYFTLASELGTGYKDEWGNWIDVFAGNEHHRLVWMDYCNGVLDLDIAKKRRISVRTVYRIINKYNKFIVR